MSTPIIAGLLMVVTGLAIMSFGLFLFYAWLPLLYGLVGFDIGLLLGRSLTGTAGTTAIILGVIGAIAFGLASYFIEPFRRILLGISGGMLIGFSIAALLGLDSLFGGFFGVILAVVCGLIGGLVVPLFFDTFVVVASSFGGAALLMTGANLLMPGLGIFDRSSGSFLPLLITAILAAAGIGWQLKNLDKWIRTIPPAGGTGKTV